MGEESNPCNGFSMKLTRNNTHGRRGDAQPGPVIPLTRHVRITKHSAPVLLKHAGDPRFLDTAASISLCHFDNKPTGDIARKRGKLG